MTSGDAGQFADIALEVVPRALGLCDRDSGSDTAGCCDRHYWHYRTTDIANARAQESGWLFALAATSHIPGSPFAGNAQMKEWSRMVWRFWLEDRNGDGSVSEVYPNERSFCATSFTSAAFVQTVALLGGAEAWGDELEAARPTFTWLAKNSNPRIGNQMAASLEALAGYGLLTGDKTFASAARVRLTEIDRMADEAGYFSEYDGVDLGYQSITLASLIRALALMGGEPEFEVRLKRNAELYLERCDAFGQFDPYANSRRTQFLYPSAFAVLCPEFLERVERGLGHGKLLRPTWLDDRYCPAMAADYLLLWQTKRNAGGQSK